MLNPPQARFGSFRQARLAFVLLSAAAVTVLSALGQRGSRPNPVVAFRGQYCSSMGPRGWAFTAENPQRSAFGADSVSPDQRSYAGYAIFPTVAGTAMASPDQAVAMHLSALGAHPATLGRRQQLDRNVFAVSYRNDQNEGMAFYEVFPFQGGAMILMRQAATSPGQWKARGAEASAVARSMRCNVPSVPAAPDPPSLNHKPKAGANEGEGDSEYNVWLEKEYYHDPATGQNYWVSPSQDWDQNGPQGPGYYTKNGNDITKLQPGYSQ
jgi:hypothetical protein